MPRSPERNKEYMKAYRKANGYKHEKLRRQRLLKFVFDYKAEKGCAGCGENDPVVLDLDHDDPELKVASISYLVGGNGASMQKILAELEKCTVRCANCHRRRTAKQQAWYGL
jgi:hypothetical protein